MTFDNNQPVEGLSNEDGTPMTRGQLVALQAADLHAIRDQVTAAVEAYDRGEITPVDMRQAAMAFATHLVGYTANVAAQLTAHDVRQMYGAPMPDTITIPDVLPDDFA